MTLGRIVSVIVLAVIVIVALQYAHVINLTGTSTGTPAPAGPTDYYTQGEELFVAGNYPEALAACTKALELGPNDPRAGDAEYRIACCWDPDIRKGGDDRKARDAYKLYLDKNPGGANFKKASERYEFLNQSLGGR